MEKNGVVELAKPVMERRAYGEVEPMPKLPFSDRNMEEVAVRVLPEAL